MSDDKKMATYVVQVWLQPLSAEQARELEKEHGFPEAKGEMPPMWMDIATVTVAVRTKRKTVVTQALAQANYPPSQEKLRLRVLDAESAEVFEPEAHQPPAEWRL